MPIPAIIAIVLVIAVLGLVIIPVVNRNQFNKMPADQKVRILMKQAKGLIYFKNVSSGTNGTLYYVKNKRKIYTFPWKLTDGKMVCTRTHLFENWDYPEERPEFSYDEIKQALTELNTFNSKNKIKIELDYELDEGC